MNVKFEVKRLNLTHTWTISRNSSNYKDNIFVFLEKDGIVGVGEAAPNIRYNETPESTIEVIKKSIPLFENCNPWEYVQLSYDIKGLSTAQTAAKAALDIALMDWIGKSLNIPLYRLWGLDHTKLPFTSFSIGIDTPEVVKQKTREAEPYKILKVKVGKKNDKELIEAVRSVAPDKVMRVDANEGWKDKETAIKEIEWLIKNGVEFIEQPMPSEMLEETRWLRDRVEIPIIADEAVKTASDIPKLAEAYDGINIKIMKAGGLQEALRMIWLAKSLNMKIMIGCMIESSVGISAASQLSSLIDYADLDGNLLISNDPYEGVKVIDGKLVLSDRPGIGVKEI
ncbi:MAG: dipeptide epimerase [Candidatus Neomarinimicrobiota bacterium]|nr:MAG: dipeptide epimerase [Candidatus Neomarinimicrobiota bacterium]